jgi:hypothetical protein
LAIGQQIEVLYARSGREIDTAFASLSQKPIDAILSGLHRVLAISVSRVSLPKSVAW